MLHEPFVPRLVLLSCALLLGACSNIPQSATAVSRFGQLSCAEIDSEWAQAQESRRAAAQAKADSWHVVMPFAVVARYTNASTVHADAEQRLVSLGEQRRDKGCAQTAGS
ncbi:MAG: hypothetical protein ACO1PM_10600 [Acidovorax sp.]|jgi:hypothetical protein